VSEVAPARRGGPSRLDTPEGAVLALAGKLRTVETETMELQFAAGRVLGADLVADRPSPASDVSAMDGYAVRVADLGAGELSVRGEVRIGHEPPAMPEGAALRIVTGAPVPGGAQAVVKREDVKEGKGQIKIERGVAANIRAGENIRRRGENLGEGELVVPAGTLITPAVAGAMAAFGGTKVKVRRRVRVGIIVTGDELVEPGQRPSAWQLRDSNGAALGALLSLHPWIEGGRRVRVGDEPKLLRAAIDDLLGSIDALILTGGVSMGTRDYVPTVLKEVGAEVLFHKLPQRPGKPVLGAVLGKGSEARPILALPGNPVSVMVTARRMAVAVLSRMAGLETQAPMAAVLDDADGKTLDLWWHRLVRVSGPGRVVLAEGRGSGDVVAAARSDGFIEVPPGQTGEGPWPFYRWSW
jgi:molybdopterin molybdotransferase